MGFTTTVAVCFTVLPFPCFMSFVPVFTYFTESNISIIKTCYGISNSFFDFYKYIETLIY